MRGQYSSCAEQEKRAGRKSLPIQMGSRRAPAIPEFLLPDGQWDVDDDGPFLALQDEGAVIVHLIVDPQAFIASLEIWRVTRRGEDVARDVAGKGFGEGEGWA